MVRQDIHNAILHRMRRGHFPQMGLHDRSLSLTQWLYLVYKSRTWNFGTGENQVKFLKIVQRDITSLSLHL